MGWSIPSSRLGDGKYGVFCIGYDDLGPQAYQYRKDRSYVIKAIRAGQP
jgi:hypothetical protein